MGELRRSFAALRMTSNGFGVTHTTSRGRIFWKENLVSTRSHFTEDSIQIQQPGRVLCPSTRPLRLSSKTQPMPRIFSG